MRRWFLLLLGHATRTAARSDEPKRVDTGLAQVLAEYDHVKLKLGASHCSLIHDPRDPAVLAKMRAYAAQFIVLAPNGFDPGSKADEKELVQLAATAVGSIGAFGVRWAPSLLEVDVHHVTQHLLGEGATIGSLVDGSCVSQGDPHGSDASS